MQFHKFNLKLCVLTINCELCFLKSYLVHTLLLLMTIVWRKDSGESGESGVATAYECCGWDVDGAEEADRVGMDDKGAVENESESTNFVLMSAAGKRW